jgi:diguanylate cyclase (GGDEF)-like protein
MPDTNIGLQRTMQTARRRPQFWRLTQRGCLIAAVVDVAFFFIFLKLDSPVLAWVNVLSVTMYLTAYRAIARRKNRLAITLFVTEVIGHSTLGIAMLGWDSGFHYYLLMFIPAIFVTMPGRKACLAAILLWLIYVVLNFELWLDAPLQPISDQALKGLNLFNLTVLFAMFGYLSFFYIKTVTRAHRKLGEIASTDPLTQLFNRRHIAELAEREIARVARNGKPLVFLLLDLDFFKEVNDEYGHETGDKVLQYTAEILRSETRNQDLVARWGGEEFLIVLPETDQKQGLVIAERLRVAIMNKSRELAPESLALTTSIGLSQYHAGSTLNDCIARADKALYACKAMGRNRVEVDPWPHRKTA